MIAKYQIGFFPKRGALFPRKKDLVWGYAFGILVISLFMPQIMGIQLTPSYQTHPLASAPPHANFFYLREKVLSHFDMRSVWKLCSCIYCNQFITLLNEIKRLWRNTCVMNQCVVIFGVEWGINIGLLLHYLLF